MSTTIVARPGLDQSIWDKVGDRFNSLVEGSIGLVSRLFGSANERAVKATGYIRPKGAEAHTVTSGSILDRVNSLEESMKALSDDDLKGLTVQYRERLKAGAMLEDLLPEAFAACREAGRRSKGMRHYDVQIVGGAILHQGNIAEMVTGEGKTLVATLAAYLNAISGQGVHVVTVNDYLARRDCEWMLPIYNALGVSAAYIQSDMDADVRRRAYESDITYGTNSEFGFDYLRDNMKPARHDDPGYHPFYRQAQRTPLNYAIIDEVDNILGSCIHRCPELREGGRNLPQTHGDGTQRPARIASRRHGETARHRRGRPARLRAGGPRERRPAELAAEGGVL